jgi:hypothetical protein
MIFTVSFVALIAGFSPAFAQEPSPGGAGSPLQRFSVPFLVGELSLFLPPEATQTPQRGPMQFPRDPKQYLTKDQIARLIPVLQALRENPMPSPSKARQVASNVESILTPGQKAERAQFRGQLQKLRERFQGQGGQRLPDFSAMTEQQRQEFLNSLPEDQRQRIQQRLQQSGGAQLPPRERRQRMLDNFIKILQDRQRQLETGS